MSKFANRALSEANPCFDIKTDKIAINTGGSGIETPQDFYTFAQNLHTGASKASDSRNQLKYQNRNNE